MNNVMMAAAQSMEHPCSIDCASSIILLAMLAIANIAKWMMDEEPRQTVMVTR